MICWIIFFIASGYIYIQVGVEFCRWLHTKCNLIFPSENVSYMRGISDICKVIFYPLVVLSRLLELRKLKKKGYCFAMCDGCRFGSYFYDGINSFGTPADRTGYYCKFRKGLMHYWERIKCFDYKYKWWWIWGCKRLKYPPFPFTQAEIDEGHRRTIQATIKQGLEKWKKEH